MSNALTAPHFQSPENAREWLEKLRWPDGPICSHCGTIGRAYALKKPGWYRCAEKECRKDFTVTTGTVMERSHIPLNKWLMAFYLLNASKKGMSAHQLHRALKLDYKSAWFMCHRIREAMRSGGMGPLGGGGKVVEADETYYGPIDKAFRNTKTTRSLNPTKGGRSGPKNKRPILALVERGGNVRTFHVPIADKDTVTSIVRENIARESRLHTDESRLYVGSDEHFASHDTVKHSADEYVRYEDGRAIHTNSAEGYFSIFKRGMRGVYQHCKEKHLHRYLAEFDHRYNYRVALGYSDIDRTLAAIRGVAGKRLTYHQSHQINFSLYR
jgi:transposase-like protein